MTEEERREAIKSIKEICRDIGCTKVSPQLCDHAPHKCGIIAKLLAPKQQGVK